MNNFYNYWVTNNIVSILSFSHTKQFERGLGRSLRCQGNWKGIQSAVSKSSLSLPTNDVFCGDVKHTAFSLPAEVLKLHFLPRG